MHQNSNAVDRELSNALYRELEALKIRIAFAELGEDELAEAENAPAVDAEYSESAQKRTLKVIQRQMNRRMRKRFLRETLPRTTNIVAAVLLVFFVGLTTATATVRPVRLKVMEFIAKIEENYSTVSLTSNENDCLAPAEWEGEYYPTYIPSDFVLSDVNIDDNVVGYTAEDDRVLEFCESGADIYANYDLGGEGCFDISISGKEGIAKVDDEQTTMVWGDNNVCFYLFFSGDIEEAKRVAWSVQRIPKL